MSAASHTLSWAIILATILESALPAYATLDSTIVRTPASSAQSVTWEDMSAMDLRQAFRSQYASDENLHFASITDSDVELALLDADDKISSEFKVPEGMRNSVGFWLRVYTQFSTQQVVLFDDRHPEIVYEVLDFRGLAKSARNRVVYEILRERRLKAKLAAYKNAFAQLHKNRKPKKLTEEQTRILSALKSGGHKHSFLELGENFRSQTGQRDNVMKGLLAADAFFPRMEKIFAELGVPSELTRLSLVESSFNLSAISKVGASGVWQFMLRSGKEYLLIDDGIGIDERLSPLKSTVAAAKLLKRNRKILGDWALAVTSYNHGLRGLRTVPANVRNLDGSNHVFSPCVTKTKKTQWETPLGWASRNYYAEFVAILHADAYRKVFYGSLPATHARPIRFHKVVKSESALAIAMEHGVPLQEFRFFNPDIQDLKRKLPKGFRVALPAQTEDLASVWAKDVKHARLRNNKL